jgi:Family of unknown function (DUF6318)
MISQVGGIRRTVVTLGAVSLACALTGCGRSTPAAAPAGPAAATTSTAAPQPGRLPADVTTTGPNLARSGERPPLMPTAAAQDTDAGAAAFAQFFLLTIDWGFASTSGTYMAHYFDPACDQCQQIKSGLDASAAQGWHFVGGRYAIKSSTVTSSSRTNPTVRVVAAIAASKTVDNNDTEQSSTPAIPNFAATLTLAWQSNSWTVVAIDTSS